jgi:hypothetical protein
MKPLYKGWHLDYYPTTTQKAVVNTSDVVDLCIITPLLSASSNIIHLEIDNSFGQCAKPKELKDTDGYEWLRSKCALIKPIAVLMLLFNFDGHVNLSFKSML